MFCLQKLLLHMSTLLNFMQKFLIILREHKRDYFVIGAIIAAVIFAAVYYGGFRNAKRAIFDGERVIKETPLPRAIERVSVVDGRSVMSTGENIALVSREHVIIEGGKTLKEGYAIAEPEARSWATDAKLVYIHSLGTVTIDGVSSGWEVVFGSKIKKKGYMVSVVGGMVVDKRDVISTSSGYTLPSDWYDAAEAVKSIQTLPQFKDATISGLNFYYNEDGKRWGYAISSSNGTVSIPVR